MCVKSVNDNGGLHVIQTFFSKELSEEVQIKGRTRRQGGNGTFDIIVRDSQLEWFLGCDWKQQLEVGMIYLCIFLIYA